jgi:hypothetical protein
VSAAPPWQATGPRFYVSVTALAFQRYRYRGAGGPSYGPGERGEERQSGAGGGGGGNGGGGAGIAFGRVPAAGGGSANGGGAPAAVTAQAADAVPRAADSSATPSATPSATSSATVPTDPGSGDWVAAAPPLPPGLLRLLWPRKGNTECFDRRKACRLRGLGWTLAPPGRYS